MSSDDIVTGWWHGNVLDDAVEVLNESFVPLGAAAITTSELRAAMARLRPPTTDEEEELLRCHHIGWMARRANAALIAAGRPERVRAFGTRAGTDDSGWCLVAEHEHEAERRHRGLPHGPARLWDDSSVEDPIAAWLASPDEPRIEDPERTATTAFAGRDYALAARAAQAWIERGDELLAPLCSMESLVALGRHAEAAPRWRPTAERWLRGFTFPISKRQWQRLVKLHARLRLPADELLARCHDLLARTPSS